MKTKTATQKGTRVTRGRRNAFVPLVPFCGLRWAQVYALLLMGCLVYTGCFNEEPSTYYGKSVPPRAQEFRWSDGGLPQTFDPAFAAAPPDTDAVRALFEGLTDYDPQTLAPVPAVATRWESSND